MRRPEVFEVITAAPPSSSMRAYSWRLIARFSMIASMMTSLAATAAGQVVLEVAGGQQRLEARREERRRLGLARRFEAAVGDLVARAPIARGAASLGTMSSSRTLMPALARWAAMAAPITPDPMTVTSLIGIFAIVKQ